MLALTFDLSVGKLKETFGEKYRKAYYETKNILKKNGFFWYLGSSYLTEGTMAELFKAVSDLKGTLWFKESLKDIRAFRVEDWSDLTSIFKEER